MPVPEDGNEASGGTTLSNADLIIRAAEALNPQLLGEGFWVADVGAAVEAEDGRVFTGAYIGGYLSICAELGALSQLVAATTPTVKRVVAYGGTRPMLSCMSFRRAVVVASSSRRCRSGTSRRRSSSGRNTPQHCATFCRMQAGTPSRSAPGGRRYEPGCKVRGPGLHSDEANILNCRDPLVQR